MVLTQHLPLVPRHIGLSETFVEIEASVNGPRVLQ
jgi:hypothetical protein